MQKLKIKVTEEWAGNKAFRAFLEALPRTFNEKGEVIHSGRNVLRVVEAENLGLEGIDRVVVKRFHGLFWVQSILYSFFFKPKGRKAYDNTTELERRGFEPAHELALVEVWQHGLYRYSFFVTEMVMGERLTKLIRGLQASHQQEAVRQVVKQYATMVKNLHERGVLYQDLNGGNVICRQDETSGLWHFALVDTNRARLYDDGTTLELKSAKKDLILMNPELGTNKMFQEEYLRQRGLYTPETAAYLLKAQYGRYARKRCWYRKLLKKYRVFYHWLTRSEM